MKILFLFLAFSATIAFAQRKQTIDADCLRIRDGYCVTKDELGSLGSLSGNIQDQLDLKEDLSNKATDLTSPNDIKYPTTQAVSTALSGKPDDSDVVHLSGSEAITGDKDFQGALTVTSTTQASKPCPAMTETQRDAISSPGNGDCVFNTDKKTLNIYDSIGVKWTSAGGGLSPWVTSNGYAVGDIVVESLKIYQCLTAHTSGTFASDLSAGKWTRLSDEFLIGTEAVGSSLNKEIILPNNQLTQIDTDKVRIETGNDDILANPSFESPVVSGIVQGWMVGGAVTPTANTSDYVEGKQSLSFSAASQTFSLSQDSTLYSTGFADGVQGNISISVKSSHDAACSICQKHAGSLVTSNCIDINRDGKWHAYNLPSVLKGTSNGLSLSCASGSGTTLVDDAKIAKGEVKQIGSAIGEWKSGSCSATWTTNTATTCKYRQVGQNAEIQWKLLLSGAPTSASLSIGMPSGLTVDSLSLIESTSANISIGQGSYLDVSAPRYYDIRGRYLDASNVSLLHKQYTSPDAAIFFTTMTQSTPVISASGDTLVFSATIPVNEFKSSVSYYSTTADYFSTSETDLTFKATAITSTDKVGTYNSYPYPASNSIGTICTSSPTVAPNKTDGFKVFTKSYTSSSTCGNPARVEIKVAPPGTILPSFTRTIYKNAASTTPRVSGNLEPSILSTTVENGAWHEGYDASTGIYTIDLARVINSTTTTHQIFFNDITAASSGYLVIDAQKAKASIVGSFNDLDYVYVEAAGNAGQSITADVTDLPFISVKDSETLWSGTSLTPKVSGVYNLTANAVFSASSSRGMLLYKDGSVFKRIGQNTDSTSTNSLHGSITVELVAGSVYTLRVNTNGGTLSNTGVSHYLTITRIPGQF